MLEKIKKIKEDLKDPKKKALAQLAIFAIFFLFIYIVVCVSNHYSSNTVVEPEKEENYTCIYNIGDTIINYDSKTNTFNNTTNIINLEYYNYENIIKETKNNDFLESTTYKDKTSKTIYELKDLDITKDNNVLYKILITKDETNFVTNIDIENLGYTFSINCQKKDE